MAWRLIRFLLFLVVGGVAGYLVPAGWGGQLGALAGVCLASVLWVGIDLRRARKAMGWMRAGQLDRVPAVPGLWGEAVDRVRRVLRTHEQALVASDARLQDFLSAIQASPNGIILLDANNQIEWCNQTASQHWGLEQARDHLQHVGNLLRDPAFASYLAGGDYSGEVIVHAPRASSSRPMRLSVQLHRYAEQRKLMMSRDITVVEQADAMRRDFVANVSHEIRTPLTVLAGFVETLQTLPLNDDERRRYLALMSQQAHRMQSLVDDLLALSRLEGSPLPGSEDWMPVEHLMSRCEQEARQLSGMLSTDTHRISMTIDGPCQIAGSEDELLSAMLNLVNNAVRYTPAGGEVKLQWRLLDDGQGEFSVSDSGPGIAAEHLPRLTERFYRVDRSRSRDTGGTGLGLAIVKHVVQRHGAQLRIESVLGQGSVFTIVLPAARVAPLKVEAAALA